MVASAPCAAVHWASSRRRIIGRTSRTSRTVEVSLWQPDRAALLEGVSIRSSMSSGRGAKEMPQAVTKISNRAAVARTTS